MANVKAIKDTGFLGSRKAIGTLRFMKAIETPKVESKTDKNNKSKVTNTTDYGFYKVVETKDGDKVISSKWVLKFGVEVNGSLTYFQTQSEDFVKSKMKKKLRLKKEGETTITEKEVSLDEAKNYWKNAQNIIGFGLLTLDELKELEKLREIEIKDELKKQGKLEEIAKLDKLDEDKKPWNIIQENGKNWLKFVTNKDFVHFMCKYKDKLEGKRVEVSSNVNLNIYKGNVGVDKGVAFLNSIKLSTAPTDIHCLEMPAIFAEDSFDSVANVSNRGKALRIALLSQALVDGNYQTKFIWTNTFIKLNKIIQQVELPQDVYDTMIGNMKAQVNAGEMILLTVDVEKGSEESGSVDLSNIDIVSKTMLENPTIAQEVKDQILEKLKATQKRGFAKETGYILEIKKTDDAYEILPGDFEGGESEDVVEVQQAGVNIGALTGMGM